MNCEELIYRLILLILYANGGMISKLRLYATILLLAEYYPQIAMCINLRDLFEMMVSEYESRG